jgi:hypothetical protein
MCREVFTTYLKIIIPNLPVVTGKPLKASVRISGLRE